MSSFQICEEAFKKAGEQKQVYHKHWLDSPWSGFFEGKNPLKVGSIKLFCLNERTSLALLWATKIFSFLLNSELWFKKGFLTEEAFLKVASLLQCNSTGVHEETLAYIGKRISSGPPNAPDFIIHKGLNRIHKARMDMINDRTVDWAVGEAIAFGSLMKEGIHVRLSGTFTSCFAVGGELLFLNSANICSQYYKRSLSSMALFFLWLSHLKIP